MAAVQVLIPGSTPLDILNRLHAITESLIEAHTATALLSNTREEGRAASYASFVPDMAIGGKDSVAARDRQAEFALADITAEIVVVKAEVSALEAEYRFLSLLLDHTHEA